MTPFNMVEEKSRGILNIFVWLLFIRFEDFFSLITNWMQVQNVIN